MTLCLPDTHSLDAALLMFRQNPAYKQCSFLFVEGEGDEKFWNGRIAENLCCIVFVVAFAQNNLRKTGKIAVIENIRALNASRSAIDGHLGLIDNDYDSLACLPRDNNLCVTDTHDLETLLLRSPAVFRKILAEFGDSQCIAAFEQQINKPIQAHLLALALPFAHLEWFKQHTLPSLELKDLHKNDTVLIRQAWRVELFQLYAVASRKGIAATEEHLLNDTAQCDPWLWCNGHTLLEILAIGFQHSALGNNKKATSDSIANYLRGAIETAELYQTELGQAIFHWQAEHPPYRIVN
ncbi:DUF4435 domain-containing protein [Methylovulum psychrotolerans]|uniref:DUF4435 domain-containing protein n=1 Tax=Methylovulum psychrotolerans TaxID=1704499 RepID=A0A1Z4BUS4_9GAMM|nr:DUF4435 domain-containing protein [Methylovulum psychrotolerans]ASF45066.1 hypothetical protein CEK71_02740 [Methylovulum psychrotolerans]